MERSYRPAHVVRESLIASGIWILVVAFLLITVSVWQVRGFAKFYEQADIAGLSGALIGQFLLLAFLAAIYGSWRLRQGVMRKFLADWRFWSICIMLVAWFAGKKASAPIIGWFAVCAIYQNRAIKRRP